MNVIWYKIWFDLWHNKVCTLLAILSISIGVFAVGITFGMSDQLLAGMDKAHQATIPAHFTITVAQNVDVGLITRLKKIPGVEDITLGNRINIRYKAELDETWENGWLLTREDYES